MLPKILKRLLKLLRSDTVVLMIESKIICRTVLAVSLLLHLVIVPI